MSTLLLKDCQFGVRAQRAFAALKITTLPELSCLTKEELHEQEGLGWSTIGKIENILARRGFTLRKLGVSEPPVAETRTAWLTARRQLLQQRQQALTQELQSIVEELSLLAQIASTLGNPDEKAPSSK